MKKRSYLWVGVLLAALLLVSTVLTGCAKPSESIAPAQNAAVGPVAASSVAPASDSSAPGAPQEGIQVHGHWTIEVRNPDGTLASHQEFENALATTGLWSLGYILGRQRSVGGWLIHAGNTVSSQSPFMESPTSGLDCEIAESTYSSTQSWVFKNLTIIAPSAGPNMNKFVLSGTATAQRDGNINQVATTIYTLGPSSPPSSSYSGEGLDFTSATITSVSVTTGQQIMVTVVISFS